jgi:hypothetical protein
VMAFCVKVALTFVLITDITLSYSFMGSNVYRPPNLLAFALRGDYLSVRPTS